MSWESPKLSKPDVEMLTTFLDDYIFYAKNDGIDTQEAEKLLTRLDDYLIKY